MLATDRLENETEEEHEARRVAAANDVVRPEPDYIGVSKALQECI